jgi:excisionase family DNA binding protein
MLDVMTPEQVADLLQLDSETVYRLIRDGKLTTVNVDGTQRVARGDLETFLAAEATMPTLREALFQRVMSVADRNPGLSSDDLLDELNLLDQETKEQAPARRP